MADLKDKKIGGFRILAEIKGASGSQGQIFKAVCENPPFAGIEPGTVVALKAMAVHDEDGQAWAKLEKRTSELVRLSHPNVVKYYGCFSESGTFNDIHAIVQEFLDGETLKQRLLRCPSGLDADEALHVTEAALAGLEYTAANGIVHRDVKPGNIFLCADGGVKLIDFEVAHQEGGTTTSASGNLVGSFDYMAPDFTNSTFRGDERSDVFSMGVVMHEAITGRTPYQRIEGGDNQANFAFLSRWARLQIDGTNPIRISSRANRLLAHSEEVLAKALAPFPQDRYANFAEFHAGLKVIRYRDLRNGDMAYRILQIVGKGGFGEVFKARLKRSNQLVAIKHLLKAAYAERFYREARIMAQLHDPCFVRFIDFFMVDHAGNREAFLVMDFLPGMPGSSLRDAIKRAAGAALPLRDTLLAFARYAHGLSVIHSRGIFHRDIKPSNLYYPEGHSERAAIMDLGIARNVHGTATTGQVPGTLDYMPPEVVLTDNRGDSGMDIYALGLCLYEALSGKMAYPRLPQGAAALTAFFARAKIKAMPDLSDPAVVGNAPLHDLLVQMTCPDPAERIVDTQLVERRLAELAEAAGVGGGLPNDSPEDDAEETSPGTVTFTIPSMEETNPAAPEECNEKGPVTGTTDGTLATDTVAEGKRAAFEQEIKRVRRKRHARNIVVAAAVAVVACGVAWVFRERLAGWFQARSVDTERPQIERLEPTYQDERAEAAANVVVSVCLSESAKTTECDEQFATWRAEWESRCSPEKFDELVKRIEKARTDGSYGKFRKAGNKLEMRYRNRQVSVEENDKQVEVWSSANVRPAGFPDAEFEKLDAKVKAARATRIREDDEWAAESAMKDVVEPYADGTSAGLAAGDAKADLWRKDWKGKLSSDAFKRMDSRIAVAHDECEKSIRRGNAPAAQKALKPVIDAYSDLKKKIPDGDKLADDWRKNWKERVEKADFARMDAQLATARAEREERERNERIKSKEKACEAECRQLVGLYRDDASDKKSTDAEYAKRYEIWKNDRDLAKDWLAARVKEVNDEKRNREVRDDKSRERERQAANDALADLISRYDDTGKAVDAVDKEAQRWRTEWRRRLDEAVFRDLESSIESARQKRVNHDEWAKTQQALAATTNEVESVRIALVRKYNDETGTNKDAIDSQFVGWAKKWEADALLRKFLPGWFAGRKKTVEEAKAACEARIAEIKRNQLVAAKTNDVATVRVQLVNGYRNDTSDKPKLDGEYTDWMLKWSSDADLPAGWFPEQRKIVEKEKTAREKRDEERMAGEEAKSVCETYRQEGVPVGDGSRKMWIRNWTNRLELAVFQKHSEMIVTARKDRERVDKEAEDRRKAKDEADRQNAAKIKAERDAAQRRKEELAAQLKAKEEAARQKAEQEYRQLIVTKTNEVESVRAVLVRDYANDSVKKIEIDARFGKWTREWEMDGDLQKMSPDWFERRKRTVEDAKNAREERIKQRMGKIEVERKRLENGYKDDSSDKAKLEDDFKKCRDRWGGDVDLQAGWLDAQMRAIETARAAREQRDNDRINARKQANLVCDVYRSNGIDAGDGSRTFWIDNWTNRLDATVFHKLSEVIGKARAERVQKDRRDAAERIGKEKRERISKKQKQFESDVKELVDAYRNTAIARTDTDGLFATRREKWEADTDLDADWVATHRGEIEKARTARIQRDVAGQNRKDAYDAALDVCKGYASGIEAGDTERQLWEGKWKSVLGEKDFAEIIAIIDKARGSAKAKAEAEQRKAEGVRLEKEISALLEVDQNQVERWKGRLADAERKIKEGQDLLGQEKVDALLNEVRLRKKWVVGVVANRTDHVIKVGGRSISPGQREYFELPEGLPQGGWQVVSTGYKPLTIDQNALDGSVVLIGEGNWKLEPIPKARIRIPQLEDGVSCRLDGVMRGSGDNVEVDSGKAIKYVYSLKGHEDQKGSFTVQGGEQKDLPAPGEWRVDKELEEWFQTKLDDAELSLSSGFGLACLEVYHEMYVRGYRLNQEDLARVEKAWERCDEDFKIAKEKAVKDGRYNLREAQEVWMKARRLYNVLTGKRVTVEAEPR